MAGRVGDGQVQMNLNHIADVRHDRQAMGQGQVGHLPPFSDAGQAHGVGLDVMNRAGPDEVAEVVEAVKLLAQGQRRGQFLGQRGVTVEVVVPDRLLEPADVVIGEVAADGQGRGQVPAAVGIDHELDARPDGRADSFDALQIVVGVGAADFDLDAAVAVGFNQRPAVIDQLVEAPVEPAAVGVVAFNGFSGAAAQKLPERQAGHFGLDIPQRDVDGAERQLGDAAAPDPLQRRIVVKPPPQVLNFERVLVDEQRAVGVGDAVGNQAVAGQVGVRAGVAVAGHAGVGADDDAGRAPMGELVGAVGYLAAGDRRVQDKGFKLGNFHRFIGWVSVVPGDRHLLSINLRRCNSNANLIRSSDCHLGFADTRIGLFKRRPRRGLFL